MGNGIRTLEQRITAGGVFDGTEPPFPPVRGSNLEAYPPAATGGLFFGTSTCILTEPHYVRSLELKLGGQTTWTVHKRDINGDELLVFRGTCETDFVSTEKDSFLLTANQRLVVRTPGTTAALICRVSIQAMV